MPLVLNKKMITASTSFFLIIWFKLSFWSIIGYLMNAVPLNGSLTIHLNAVLMVVPEMAVPEDVSPILPVVPLVLALLLDFFLNIKMNFLQKLSTLSRLTLVEHLLLIVSTI